MPLESATLTSPPNPLTCCSPLRTAPMDVQQATDLAPILKAIADPSRLRLLSIIAADARGEVCVCDLNDALDLSQPTISHHLKVLHEADLLIREKRGVWVYYSVNTETLNSLCALFGGVC